MWQKSKCGSGWFHKFQPSRRELPDGWEEICERCGKAVFHGHGDPNEAYLAYNMRRVLHPARDIEYYEEYNLLHD